MIAFLVVVLIAASFENWSSNTSISFIAIYRRGALEFFGKIHPTLDRCVRKSVWFVV